MFLKIRGRSCGPFTREDFLKMIQMGKLKPDNEISEDGQNWFLIGEDSSYFAASPFRQSWNGSGTSCSEQRSSESFDSIEQYGVISDSTTQSGSQYQDMREWYVSNDGQQSWGPYSEKELWTMLQNRQISPDSIVWREGGSPCKMSEYAEFSFTQPLQDQDSNCPDSMDDSSQKRDEQEKSEFHYFMEGMIRKYMSFEDRARRKEYCFFTLYNGVFLIVALFFIAMMEVLMQVNRESLYVITSIVLGLWGLMILIPFLALSSRRLHDIGASAWFLLLFLFPPTGLFLMMVLLITSGQSGANSYGSDPR